MERTAEQNKLRRFLWGACEDALKKYSRYKTFRGAWMATEDTDRCWAMSKLPGFERHGSNQCTAAAKVTWPDVQAAWKKWSR